MMKPLLPQRLRPLGARASSGARAFLWVGNENYRLPHESVVKDFFTTAAAGDSISLGEYYRQFAADVSERQARRDLETLLEIGAVTREGAGSKTRYVRTNRTP